jgi:membrane-associated protein
VLIELPVEWMQNSPHWVVLLVPLLAFVESCIGIGLFVSGVFLLSTCVLLYGQQLMGIPGIAASAFTGTVLGDLVGYMAGKLVGPKVKTAAPFRHYKSNMARVEAMFVNSAGLAICWGRFIPAIRSITPMLAGISEMSPRE